MKLLKMAGRLYLGYRLKALSLFVFTSIAFTLILAGVSLLYNSFSIFLDEDSQYYLPPFYVCGDSDYDIYESAGIKDLSLPRGSRAALEKKLSKFFDIHEGVFFSAILNPPGNSDKRIWAFIVAMDISKLPDTFPASYGLASGEDLSRYRQAPYILVSSPLAHRMEAELGSRYVLLSENYHRNFNAIRFEVAGILKPIPGLAEDKGIPLAFVDISQISKLFAMPASVEYPLFLIPKHRVSSISLGAEILASRLKAAAEPLGLGWKTALTINKNTYKSYMLYLNILRVLVGTLFIILIVSVSSNLFISFQGRLSDFGLFKAFGLGSGRLFLLILYENALGLTAPFIVALTVNFLVGRFLKPFDFLGTRLSFTIRPEGIIVLGTLSLAVCLVSILQSYRFLRKRPPIAAMGED